MSEKRESDFRPAAGAPRCGKILLIISEDWFALSHFKPLMRALVKIGDRVVIATNPSGRRTELEALGLEVVDFDLRRSSLDPLEQARVVRRLAGLIDREKADVVHVVALQMMVIAALALSLTPSPRAVFHLTGLGFLGSQGKATAILRRIALLALGRGLRRPGTWLLAENRDDVAVLKAGGADAGQHVTILGGAGIDPELFPLLPEPTEVPPVAAFVGRLIRSKGLDVLAEAARLLKARRTPLSIELYGRADTGNREAFPPEVIDRWQRDGLFTWHGHVADVRAVWARAAFAILPTPTREGLPRALLEAFACGRPAVATDVPGCRHLVRHEREGLLVRPGSARDLADALERLATNADVRRRLGSGARARVLDGFTEADVMAAVTGVYARLLQAAGRS
jgi:glycosyltransferase involved in cell wall biosynthesis